MRAVASSEGKEWKQYGTIKPFTHSLASLHGWLSTDEKKKGNSSGGSLAADTLTTSPSVEVQKSHCCSKRQRGREGEKARGRHDSTEKGCVLSRKAD